jgi:hypothetical protein
MGNGEEAENLALRYLLRAGLMNRVQFVGIIRPHIPMCDAAPPPEKIPRG